MKMRSGVVFVVVWLFLSIAALCQCQVDYSLSPQEGGPLYAGLSYTLQADIWVTNPDDAMHVKAWIVTGRSGSRSLVGEELLLESGEHHLSFSRSYEVSCNTSPGTIIWYNIIINSDTCSEELKIGWTVAASPSLIPRIELPELVRANVVATFTDASSPSELVADWSWSIDGVEVSMTGDSSLSHTFRDKGRHTVTLDVISRCGGEHYVVEESFIVSPEFVPPQGKIAWKGTRLYKDSLSTFYIRDLIDPDGGEIRSIEWDFGNGTYATGESVEHAYNAAGTYIVRATVCDDQGLCDTLTATARVRLTDVQVIDEVVGNWDGYPYMLEYDEDSYQNIHLGTDDGPRNFEDAVYADRVGFRMRGVKVRFANDSLVVRFELTEDNFRDSIYVYDLRLTDPNNAENTFFIFANPQHQSIQLSCVGSEMTYRNINNVEGVRLVVDGKYMTLYIPDFETPFGHDLTSLTSWRVYSHVIYWEGGNPGSDISEWFALPGWVTYDSFLATPASPVAEISATAAIADRFPVSNLGSIHLPDLETVLAWDLEPELPSTYIRDTEEGSSLQLPGLLVSSVAMSDEEDGLYLEIRMHDEDHFVTNRGYTLRGVGGGLEGMLQITVWPGSEHSIEFQHADGSWTVVAEEFAYEDTLSALRAHISPDVFLELGSDVRFSDIQWQLYVGANLEGNAFETVLFPGVGSINPELRYPPSTDRAGEEGGFLSLLETAPFSLTFDEGLVPEAYCPDGACQHSELSGYDVEGIKVGLSEDGLGIGVELHEEDVFGQYGYIVYFRGEQSDLAVFLRPNLDLVEVEIHASDVSQVIALLSGDLFDFDDNHAYVWIPMQYLEGYIDPAFFLQVRVDFHLDYETTNRREMYFFPGYATVACLEDESSTLCEALLSVSEAAISTTATIADQVPIDSFLATPASPATGELEYSETVEVVAYLDWKTVPLSETATWGLPGCDVKSVEVSVSSADLLIELELHTDGLTSGNFEAYALDLHLPSGDHVYISLIPEDRSAILEYYDGTTNQYVATVSGNRISHSPQGMSAEIPISEFRSLVSKDELCNATFSFLLEAYPGEHHEIFWFPGQAAVDCQQ